MYLILRYINAKTILQNLEMIMNLENDGSWWFVVSHKPWTTTNQPENQSEPICSCHIIVVVLFVEAEWNAEGENVWDFVSAKQIPWTGLWTEPQTSLIHQFFWFTVQSVPISSRDFANVNLFPSSSSKILKETALSRTDQNQILTYFFIPYLFQQKSPPQYLFILAFFPLLNIMYHRNL